MGQHPVLDDMYRYERNEHNFKIHATRIKQIFFSGIIVYGVILFYNLFS